MKLLSFFILIGMSFAIVQSCVVSDFAVGLDSITPISIERDSCLKLDEVIYDKNKPYDKSYFVSCTAGNISKNIVIRIAHGELISVGADVIVDAANNQLNPAGTVSLYLYKETNRATGITENEWAGVLKQWKKDNKREFVDGDALFNTHKKAYILDNKKKKMHLIHAVGPVGVKSNASEELKDMLASAYTESLRVADENGFKKIVFPAISTGVFGGDPKTCGEIEINAILSYLNSAIDTHIEEIILLVWSGYNNEEQKKEFFDSYDQPLKKYFNK